MRLGKTALGIEAPDVRVFMAFPGGNVLLLLLGLSLALVHGFDANEVSFEESGRKIYDMAPKIRIKGAGFLPMSAEVDLLELELEPPSPKSDFKVSVKDDTTLILELASGKTWVPSGSDMHGTPLVIKSATFKDTPLQSTPSTIGNIIPTPVVFPSTNIVYLTATPYFVINGTHFSIKDTSLFFSPPLKVGPDVSVQIVDSTKIIVTLLMKRDNSHQWAEEPGPLKLYAIDTGAGPLRLRGELGGVTIAELQADLKHQGIRVEDHNVQLYQSSHFLTISGEGFQSGNTRFRFGNGITEGSNFTTNVTEGAAVLSLVENRKWKSNAAVLPSDLILLAANAGDGWVPVGSTSAKAGRKVATIFEDPRVNASSTEVVRTLTHELMIKGTGFTSKFPPIFIFDPEIGEEDYLVQVIDRNHVKVVLAKTGAGWMDEGESGDLFVKVVNTGAGLYPFEKPVKVAVVVADPEKHESGIDVQPNYDAVLYQSSNKPLVVEGESFPDGVKPNLTFSMPNGPDKGAVTWETVSDTRLKLSLVEGHTWAPNKGPLFLTSVAFGDAKVDFPSPGVKIATVLADPIVEASQLQIYASHTRSITIQGRGFVSEHDPHLTPMVELSPTPAENYEVQPLHDISTKLSIRLTSTSSAMWANVVDEGKTVPLKVVSIDTGAGQVKMPGGGIVVGMVYTDDDTYICDDSCTYSNDGMCDEDQFIDLALGRNYSPTQPTSSSGNPVSRGYAGGPNELGSSIIGDDAGVQVPRCEIGTDCTDCGLTRVDDGQCDNTCIFARDGSCDDRRGSGFCPDGTDCQDCGRWGSEFTNFTVGVETDAILSSDFDDDDKEFLVNDPLDVILGEQRNNGRGKYKRIFKQRTIIRKESEEGGVLLMDILWSAIVLVGITVSGVILIFIFRCMKGEKVEIPIPRNPDVESRR